MAPIASRAQPRSAKRRSGSSRAGLVFPVSRVRRALKRVTTTKQRIGGNAPVYLAAVMEYLSAEILEISGQVARECLKKRLLPRHIRMTINGDQDFEELLRKVCIPGAGVGYVGVHPALLPKNKKAGLPAVQAGSVGHPYTAQAPVPASRRKPAPQRGPARGKAAQAKMKFHDVPFGLLFWRMLPNNVKVSVVKGDIAKVKADALVHPSAANFNLHGEIGKHLGALGGKKFIDLVNAAHAKNGPIGKNDASLSPGHNFASPWVLHVNSPHWNETDEDASLVDLRETIRNTLELACIQKFTSIALPSIGSGVNRYPKQAAAHHILNEVSLFFDSRGPCSLKQVFFVLYDEESIRFYQHELKLLKAAGVVKG